MDNIFFLIFFEKNTFIYLKKMELRKLCNNDEYADINYRIQSKYNLIRLKLYNLVKFNKRFNDFHKKYRENIIEQIKGINKEFISNESHFYIISEDEEQKRKGESTTSSSSLSLLYSEIRNGEKIYLISQKNFYRVKAMKLILKSLFEYDKILMDYSHYLRHKINSLIKMQIDFRLSYEYLLNIIHSDGNEYNRDFEILLEDFQ